MKRLFVLFSAASILGFTACEPHKKEELPKEFQERGAAKKEAAPQAGHAAPEAPKH